MLADRIKQALEVLNGEHVKGTLRDQAGALIGEPLDDEAAEYVGSTALVVYADTFKRALKAGWPERDCHATALATVLLAGIGIGKRLGIEDGEKYAKEIGGGWQ